MHMNGVQVLSIACCVFYSHCGNEPTQPLRLSSTLHLSDMTSQQRDEHDFAANVTSSFWGWNAQLVKEQVCQKWLAPVGSAEDYPVFSKWVLYGEVGVALPAFWIQLTIQICPIMRFAAHAESFQGWKYTQMGLSLVVCAASVLWGMCGTICTHLTCLFFVGHIHRAGHCKLCGGALNWVGFSYHLCGS